MKIFRRRESAANAPDQWEHKHVRQLLAAADANHVHTVYGTLQLLVLASGDDALGSALWTLAAHAVQRENDRGNDTSNAQMGCWSVEDAEQVPPEYLMAAGGPEAVGGIGGTRFFVAALRGDMDTATAIWRGVVAHDDQDAVTVARREFVGVVAELSLALLHPHVTARLDES